MKHYLAGPLIAALLGPVAVEAAALLVLDADGAVIFEQPVAEGAEWCLRWNHSVTGGPVADCFQIIAGQMTLMRSYLHDFAAGLGHIPGRGVQRAAEEGGYWIDEMNEPVAGNTLRLRVGGPAVDHRIVGPDWQLNLSSLGQGTRVILRPAPKE